MRYLSLPAATAISLILCMNAKSIGQQPVAQQPTPVAEAATQPAEEAEAKPSAKISAEAQVALRRGNDFMKAKQYKKAVAMYTTAARIYPQVGQIRHSLGLAYYQDKNPGKAWLQFRQAVRLNPRYVPGIQDFLKLWQVFEAKSIFAAGRPREDVARLLGKPDSSKPNEGGEVWQYGFKQLHFVDGKLAAIVDPRGVDQRIMEAVDSLNINFDDQSRWRMGYRVLDRIQSLTEYIPQGQSLQNWQEMYVVQRLHGVSSKLSPSQFMKDVETRLKKNNPAVEFRVLADNDSDSMYHWRDVGDAKSKRPPQHEIDRIVAGERDLYRIAYIRKVSQIPDEDAKAWAGILAGAKLEKFDPAKTANP